MQTAHSRSMPACGTTSQRKVPIPMFSPYSLAYISHSLLDKNKQPCIQSCASPFSWPCWPSPSQRCVTFRSMNLNSSTLTTRIGALRRLSKFLEMKLKVISLNPFSRGKNSLFLYILQHILTYAHLSLQDGHPA